MPTTWPESVEFIRLQIQELLSTEFDQVRYGDVSMAYLLAMVIVSAGVVTILRLLFIRRQHARQHSGCEQHQEATADHVGKTMPPVRMY